MLVKNISDKSWTKTTVRKDDREFQLWLAGRVKKFLFGKEIFAVACYETPNEDVSIIDIRERDDKYLSQGSEYSNPERAGWEILMKVGTVTMNFFVPKFLKDKDGVAIILNGVWVTDFGSEPDNSILALANFGD